MMNQDTAAALLLNTLSPDANARQYATQELENALTTNFPNYVDQLSSTLVNDRREVSVRTAAGLALKNALSAREAATQQSNIKRWFSLDPQLRKDIRDRSINALGYPNTGSFAAQVVAAIGGVELSHNTDLVNQLLEISKLRGNSNLLIGALQSIGFICESNKSELLSSRSNDILTVVVPLVQSKDDIVDKPTEVQLAALHALYNSLEFVRVNFEQEGERNYIMQTVCEATQYGSVALQVAAFECLVKIMALYYDKMAFYMEQALFGLTVMGMNHTDERVALQAVEFWTTVCEEEIELAHEAREAAEYGEPPEVESKFFAKVALGEIVPVLLALLMRQEENADEDEWNISMSAGTCLGFMAQAVADPIVALVIPFIQAKIESQDWHEREAAVMAFGSILDGPDPSDLTPIVNEALPLLVVMMNDPNPQVKDTVAWTLGRICDLLIVAVDPGVDKLASLVGAFIGGLRSNAKIASNCCWALMNLADQLGYLEEEPSCTGPLSPHYARIVDALWQVTTAKNSESNLRTTACEAISSYMAHTHTNDLHVAAAMLKQTLEQMTMNNQDFGIDKRNEIQSSFCSIVISIIRRVGKGIQPFADEIMVVVIDLLSIHGKVTTIFEDAFLVAGALASALEADFAVYMAHFCPYLIRALGAHEDSQLCMVTVGIIGDISRALGPQSALYARTFMAHLFQNLTSTVLNRNVKIPILSCLGDIALAIGENFEPYLGETVSVLKSAAELEVNPLDMDLMDYAIQLREGILEAYTGIVTGLKNTSIATRLLPHSVIILEFIQRCLADDERPDSTVKLCFGLLGDLADCFPDGSLKQYLLSEWVASELRSKRGMSPETKKTMRWAREVVKRATA